MVQKLTLKRDVNLDNAFDIAADKLNIDNMLSSKEFDVSDPKKMKDVYKFIGQLFKYFAPNHEIFSKKATKMGERFKNKKLGGDDDEEESPTATTPQKDQTTETAKTPQEIKVSPPKEPVKEVELCEECGENPATKYCNDCGTKQCSDCSEQLHKVKKRKDHVIVSIDNMSTLPPKKEVPVTVPVVTAVDNKGNCDNHASEKVVAYCKTCDVPLCTQCMLKDHDGHTKLDLTTAKDEILQEFDKNFKILENCEKSFSEAQVALKLTHDSAKKEIESYFNSVREALKKIKKLK